MNHPLTRHYGKYRLACNQRKDGGSILNHGKIWAVGGRCRPTTGYVYVGMTLSQVRTFSNFGFVFQSPFY